MSSLMPLSTASRMGITAGLIDQVLVYKTHK